MDRLNQDDYASQNLEVKKAFRKISFKCRKPSIYHHSVNSNSTNTSMVAYLTSKFNEIDAESKSQKAEIDLLIKRISSYKATQVQVDKLKRVARKPSVKMKPVIKSNEHIGIVVQGNKGNLLTGNVHAASGHVHKVTQQNEGTFSIGNVRAAIENFERRNSEKCSSEKYVPKPLVPLKPSKGCAQLVINEAQIKTDVLKVQTLTNNATDTVCIISPLTPIVPNTSFLWRKRSQELHPTNEVESYEIVDIVKANSSELVFENQLKDDFMNHCYEYCRVPPKYEDLDDSLVPTKHEDIYETIPYIPRQSLPVAINKQEEPLPPRPTSWSGQYNESVYESIYNMEKITNQCDNYETICDYSNWEVSSNQSSLISDQKKQ